MIQFLDVNATGIIGHISRLNNKGTRVIVYVNYIDERGIKLDENVYACSSTMMQNVLY